MSVQKGVNNFATYQKIKVDFIIERIDSHIERLRNSKGTFNTFNALAKYLAALLTEDLIVKWHDESEKRIRLNKPQLQRPKPLSNSTLYRNLNYRAKLESFMTGHSLIRGTDLLLAKTELPMANAKITELRIQNSNFRNEITVLERYIENSGIHEIDEKPNQKLLSLEGSTVNDFAQTARALWLLIDASEGQFKIENKQLIATHKMVNNIVVNRTTLTPFIKWFEKNGWFLT